MDTVISAIAEPVMIFAAAGSIIKMNRAALLLCGCDSIEEANRCLRGYPREFETFFPDGRPMAPGEWPVSRALKGETVLGREMLVRRGGKERLGLYSAVPVFGAEGGAGEGEVVMAVVTARDITEPRKAEDALRDYRNNLEEMVMERMANMLESSRQLKKEISGRKRAEEEKARLAAAVQSTAEVVMIVSAQGKIEYVNPAFEQTTGYTKEEVLGRSPALLGSGRHGRSFHVDLVDRVRSGKTWTGRMATRKKKGELMHFEGTVSPVRDRAGKVISYVTVFEDVTDRIRLESIAEAACTMNSLGYAFAGLRHELVNPLNSINFSLGVLSGKLDPSLKVHIERVQAEVARMQYLLKSLRNFNMYEDLEISRLDLPAFLGEFVSLIKSDFTRKGISVALNTGDEVCAMCDPRALKQVLLNLAANSADAMAGAARPEMRFGLFRLGRMSMIRVEDNGSGMDGRQLQNLFKPFNTTKKQGTGLGLVIVKKIITKMGGEVQIASVKGRGTTVDIFLPACPPL
ncbi:MAG: PAS domain S-box protein [Nitrospiraceae bacterium]|nr:PAS domain S-box protein [Nitrospiraceae bacterium]